MFISHFGVSLGLKKYAPEVSLGTLILAAQLADIVWPNLVLLDIAVWRPGWAGLWAVFLTSFFMSLMFPTIFALGLKRLGPNTKIGGSLLVMAIVGGAVLTPLMGWIAEARHSIALAYTVPLVAYAFVAAYAFGGAKAGLPRETA